MDPQTRFCHNPDWPARGRLGLGNIRVHSRSERRDCCTTCGRIFAETRDTPFYRLKTPADLVTIVMTLLCHGCPLQAIVAAYGLDERTVAAWRDRAGRHGQHFHEHHVLNGQVELGHVQADGLYVKTVAGRVWMAMAMTVPSRLWLGGVISPKRDLALITAVVRMVRSAARSLAVLVCVDGLASYVTAFARVFGDQHGVYRTAQCDVPRRPEPAGPPRSGDRPRRRDVDRGDVPGGVRLQLLLGPRQPPGHGLRGGGPEVAGADPRDGGGADGPWLDDARVAEPSDPAATLGGSQTPRAATQAASGGDSSPGDMTTAQCRATASLTIPDKRIHTAGELGFEPRLADPESAVTPSQALPPSQFPSSPSAACTNACTKFGHEPDADPLAAFVATLNPEQRRRLAALLSGQSEGGES